MHLGQGTHSKDSLTYADKWLLKEHNAINIQFVRAHGDELSERPCLLSKENKLDAQSHTNSTAAAYTASSDRGSRDGLRLVLRSGVENTLVAVQTHASQGEKPFIRQWLEFYQELMHRKQ